MKRFFLLLLALGISGAVSARVLTFGVRGGVNFTDCSFKSLTVGDTRFSPGSVRAGFDTGFVLRLNLARHLHLQSELDYTFANYEVLAGRAADNRISIRNERLEIPVLLGLRFGAFRLFGGVRFRVTDSSRSNNQQLLRVKFDSGKSDLVGGIGFDIRKFFLDFRVSGISWDKTRYGFSSGGATRRVEVSRDIVYGASLGFFF